MKEAVILMIFLIYELVSIKVRDVFDLFSAEGVIVETSIERCCGVTTIMVFDSFYCFELRRFRLRNTIDEPVV